jgi:hypothetical protein
MGVAAFTVTICSEASRSVAQHMTNAGVSCTQPRAISVDGRLPQTPKRGKHKS